jgi:hypothetical protein
VEAAHKQREAMEEEQSRKEAQASS